LLLLSKKNNVDIRETGVEAGVQMTGTMDRKFGPGLSQPRDDGVCQVPENGDEKKARKKDKILKRTDKTKKEKKTD
jgi:hypothetical protein